MNSNPNNDLQEMSRFYGTSVGYESS